jgi:hypothetical protein
MKIENLIQTCSACPSQWNFITDENRCCYVRYRWGYLSVCISEPNGTLESAVNGVEIFGRQCGGGFGGIIDWSVVEGFIKDIDIINTLASMVNDKGPESEGEHAI